MSTNGGNQAENAISNLVVASYTPIQLRQRSLIYSPRRTLKRRLRSTLGEAPKNATELLVSLIADCDLRAYDTRRTSKRWGSAYYLFGLPAAVLATIAGATGLASTTGRIAAAIIALIAAGLTTAATFLNSNVNKQHSSELSAGWQGLADDARLAVIRYGQNNDQVTSTGQAFNSNNSLIEYVIRFNKQKAALLRGDTTPVPEERAKPAEAPVLSQPKV